MTSPSQKLRRIWVGIKFSKNAALLFFLRCRIIRVASSYGKSFSRKKRKVAQLLKSKLPAKWVSLIVGASMSKNNFLSGISAAVVPPNDPGHRKTIARRKKSSSPGVQGAARSWYNNSLAWSQETACCCRTRASSHQSSFYHRSPLPPRSNYHERED